MARPKRQRPAWLPKWIPFKDGRFLGLARQTILAWISTLLALFFFSLTVSYAAGRSGLSQLKFVRSSNSKTILILRVLSEAAAVFLAATIHATFEVVQWVLISRPGGIRLPQFLALQSSTGPLGLMVLALGMGMPPAHWPMKPRILSLVRLIAQLTVPVLGVLIMSNVNTITEYAPIQDTVMPFAFGMEPFNASVASQLGVMQDLLLNLNYVSFLTNPLHAVNLAPNLDQTDGCDSGLGVTKSCSRHVLIAQEYQNVDASLPLSKHDESRVVLCKHQRAYSLKYKDNIEFSRDQLRCEDFTSGPQQYRICIRDEEDGWLHAALIPCPSDLLVQNRCAQDNSWHSSPGFTTALQPSFLHATITYNRQNGLIISHDLESSPTPANISSTGLLSALKTILNTTTPLSEPSKSNPILGSPTHFFGRLVGAQLYRISKLMEMNPEAKVKGTNALQALLALTLFYCQNGILSQTVLRPNDSDKPLQGYRLGAFAEQEKTATVALAHTMYKINVGHSTLIAYIVLSGVTLLVCLVALAVGSLLELVNLDAEPTLWPALDFWTQCRVEGMSGKVVSAQDRVEMAWIYDGRELLKSIEGLRVLRRKRKMRGIEGVVEGVEMREA